MIGKDFWWGAVSELSLEVEDGNLRVLLHRGRARLRRGLEALLV